ncbi:MAG: MtrAB system histidine kinase MtrB [Kineosporiaceae bacterium]
MTRSTRSRRRRLLARAARPGRHLVRSWRRNLQVRVVAATGALGLVVVMVLGQFLYDRIRDGLLERAQREFSGQAKQMITGAQKSLNSRRVTGEADARQAVDDMIATLQGPRDDQNRSVLVLRALGAEDTGDWPAGGRLSYLRPDDITPELRRQVNTPPAAVAFEKITLQGPQSVPATRDVVVVGGLVDVPQAGPYEVYIGFRLSREHDVLQVVQRTFVAGGFALVVLVAGVAMTVTRQVVAPVRQAARTAEELASGRLDRRMGVRGDDDLARLGRAFNEMADSLERQIHRLEELSRVQRRFVSDVSHELRTPLTTIRMAGEVIYEARADLDPAASRSAELLQDQLDRFEALLADLLEISRFDAGAAVLEVEETDLADVVARVAEGLRPLAERKGGQIVVAALGEPAVAALDPRRVERILRNLLANALDHGEGHPVHVTVAADEDAVAVGVRDHGVGLRAEELGMVFSRFWRADPARARTTGGTGLGLAISQEDAHLHGGRLTVWGAPGRGAWFVLTLPRNRAALTGEGPLDAVPDDAFDFGVGDDEPREAGDDQVLVSADAGPDAAGGAGEDRAGSAP